MIFALFKAQTYVLIYCTHISAWLDAWRVEITAKTKKILKSDNLPKQRQSFACPHCIKYYFLCDNFASTVGDHAKSKHKNMSVSEITSSLIPVTDTKKIQELTDKYGYVCQQRKIGKKKNSKPAVTTPSPSPDILTVFRDTSTSSQRNQFSVLYLPIVLPQML